MQSSAWRFWPMGQHGVWSWSWSKVPSTSLNRTLYSYCKLSKAASSIITWTMLLPFHITELSLHSYLLWLPLLLQHQVCSIPLLMLPRGATVFSVYDICLLAIMIGSAGTPPLPICDLVWFWVFLGMYLTLTLQLEKKWGNQLMVLFGWMRISKYTKLC